MTPTDRLAGDARAQSETLGSVLLLGVVVLAVSTFGVFYLASVVDGVGADGPPANVDGRVTTEGIRLTHLGGESVRTDALSLTLVVDGVRQSVGWADGSLSGTTPDSFDPGESWSLTRAFETDDAVTVRLADRTSNTLLFDGTANPAAPAIGDDTASADVAPPRLVDATWVSASAFRVYLRDFESGLNASSVDAGDFEVAGATVSGIDTSYVNDGSTSVERVTVFTGSDVSGTRATITVSNVRDLAGNVMRPQSTDAVRGEDGPTDETPAGNEDPGFAYEDTDGDGEYTANDTTVSKTDLLDGYDAGDEPLVIPDSVGEIRTDENAQVEFSGTSVDIEASIIAAKNVRITATEGDVSLVNSNLTATGGGGGNGRIVVSAPDGSINATDASFYADKEITLSARDDVILARATLDGPAGVDGVTASATVDTGEVVVTDARFLGGADPLHVGESTVVGTPAAGEVA